MSSSRSYDADTVIVGSGFGGTICAWTLWNKSQADGRNEKILVIERGGWWISPEKPATKMRGFLEERAREEILSKRLKESRWHPHFWSRPDHTLGFLNQVAHFRRNVFNREGLYDVRRFKDLWVLVGNGVGGGSLVYANVTVAPDDEVLDSWPSFYGSLNSRDLRVEFEQARRFIGVSKIVTRHAGLGEWDSQSKMYVPKNRNWLLDRTRIFEDACEAARKASPDVDLKFEYADLSITELPEAALNGGPPEPGKEINYCERQGRCVLGCLPGARRTLNKLLFKALTNAPADRPLVDLKPLCEVYDIEPLGDPRGRDGYIVHFKDLVTRKKGVLKAKRVILAGGTLGTAEILLNSRRTGHLPELSEKVGTQFSINGDSFGFVQPTKDWTNAARGPVTTSHVKVYQKAGWEWRQPFGARTMTFSCTIEDSGIPKMWAPTISGGLDWIKSVSSLRKLLRRGWLKVRRTRRRLRYFGSVHKKLHRATTDPKAFETEDESVSHTFFFACMGLDRGEGTMRLRSGLFGRRLTIDWPDIASDPVFKKIGAAMRELSQPMIDPKEANAFLPDPVGDLTGASRRGRSLPISVHPIGGCPMGRTAREGVVNGLGEVYRGYDGAEVYENLSIADGSILPTAIGVNPSLTISAFAFKIAKHIAGLDGRDDVVEEWLRRLSATGL